MSYLHDKVACKSCGDLFDPDLLNEDGDCRDCKIDRSFLDDLLTDNNERGEDLRFEEPLLYDSDDYPYSTRDHSLC